VRCAAGPPAGAGVATGLAGPGPGAPPRSAVALAGAHLRALGCRVEEGAGGLDVRAGRARVRCEVGWAGPVGLALGCEADVQAACGLMHVHGRRYGGPAALGVDYASCLAGVLAATGVLAGLAGGGPAVAVGTSVAQAALLAVGQYLAAATADDDRPEPASPGGPPFEAADGVRFELETLDPEAWRDFWAALGVDRSAAGRGWGPFQQRYATAVCPLPAELPAATARRAFADLRRTARAHGVDLTPVAAEPHPAAEAAPWRLRAAGPGRCAARGTGAPGEPLRGVTVVEVCRRVQGPLAGHLLRMLGARVVRVEPAGGDPMRGMPPMAGDCSARFTALNRGKDTVETDLRTAAGRAAVRELAAGADVFLHTLAPGKDRALGLDADALTAVRPGLVHAAASGWGDARGRRPPVGTDFPVQAWSGLAALVTPPGLPPAPSLLTLTDVLGGAVCAEGAVAGLLAARTGGRGQAVTSALLAAARMLCAGPFRTGAARPFRTGAVRPAVPVCTDLAALAADPRFRGALEHGRCTLVRSPWEFAR
jgi:crotonobetainyl-CoA:carnitine CoA-transferase CaiB-like acyl-CoA transferase